MSLRLLLTGLPFLGLLVGVHWADRVTPYLLGLPFLFFYVAAWVVLTSLLMAVVAWLDARSGRERDAAGDGTAEPAGDAS